MKPLLKFKNTYINLDEIELITKSYIRFKSGKELQLGYGEFEDLEIMINRVSVGK